MRSALEGGEVRLEGAPGRTPLGAIHGDLHAQHLVWHADAPPTVIDVLGSYYYLAWELSRAFFSSVPGPRGVGARQLREWWHNYLRGYEEMGPHLSADEIAAGLDVYLLQLTASLYGISTADEHVRVDPELAAFWRWRTDTAVTLADLRSELHSALSTS